MKPPRPQTFFSDPKQRRVSSCCYFLGWWWRFNILVGSFMLLETTVHSLALLPCIAERSSARKISHGTTSACCSQANEGYETDVKVSALQEMAEKVLDTLIKSDSKRNTGYDGASTGWTAWVDETVAAHLQNIIERIELVNASSMNIDDEYRQWTRWIRSCPAPMILELSQELRDAVVNLPDFEAIEKNTTTIEAETENRESYSKAFLERIGMRLIYLPSGGTLSKPLQTAPGAMVFGKLLSGGVTRFRLIGSSNANNKRRAGERTVIVTSDPAQSLSWLQYGGPERNYEALDIGFAFLLEVILLPTGLCLPMLLSEMDGADDIVLHENCRDMIASNLSWKPEAVLSIRPQTETSIENGEQLYNFRAMASKKGNWDVCTLETDFCSTIGGLQSQINEIVRRVLDGRVIRPVSDASDTGILSFSSEIDQIRRQEMQGLLELGLHPVKGVLLYGPPGCGKTHLARQISKILDARPPKIVAAPELLDRWVGGTERMVRELFSDAENELQMCGGDPTKSALHVIVVDEIDAVFRKRSAVEISSEVTRASAVNQILSKLDGVRSLENVLFIGMTNRRELLDEALLRPGRLECQIEIPLPDQRARREILKIHFRPLRERGRLSQPLCQAIDGKGGRRAMLKKMNRFSNIFASKRESSSRIFDLACDTWTRGFSGADLAGLVRNAGSIALARARMQGEGGLDSLQITLTDVDQALKEIKLQRNTL